ncbi:MAG TPA: hypothetical protein VNA25_15345 [Phycisphaerae bacterium]|nr:hypothetical protein [Phycisphaerae bacterium]
MNQPMTQRGTRICIWIILIGLLNFLAYSLIYMSVGGEAIHGPVTYGADGRATYNLKSPSQEDIPVSRGVYIYSGIHSISIWPTVGAVMLAMLTLAKERIASSMRSTIVRGRTLITVLATIIAFTTTIVALWFILQFARRFTGPPAKARPAATQPWR